MGTLKVLEGVWVPVSYHQSHPIQIIRKWHEWVSFFMILYVLATINLLNITQRHDMGMNSGLSLVRNFTLDVLFV